MAVNIGKLIRRHRKKAGITQKELADLAGVGKTTVFDVENNKQTVRFENIMRLLAVLNIKLTAASPFGYSEEIDISINK
ncbi:MAG: helix-turn-helix transcriptional regulator [Bacteroidetes bacterium]|nr:helix-turn-helix transcriptional regulator [Bacteroidota bacterium]